MSDEQRGCGEAGLTQQRRLMFGVQSSRGQNGASHGLRAVETESSWSKVQSPRGAGDLRFWSSDSASFGHSHTVLCTRVG